MRLLALPLTGTTDVRVFTLWADTAADEGVGRIYGTGGVFPERRVLERDGVRTKVNYPPLLLYELAAARALRLPLKALTIIADALLTLLLWATVRARLPGGRSASLAALACWLNPALILTGSVLGYVEPLLVLPAAAALVAASSGFSVLAGALAAAAMLTKQSAVLALPATLLALAVGEPIGFVKRFLRFAAGAAAVTAAATAQVAWAGGAPNMAWSLAAPLRDPFLSGNAANAWWLIGKAAPDISVDACRAAAAAAVLAVIAWTIARARPRADLWLAAAAGALSFHAYHALAVSAHEPHLAPAVPLLALAAAGRPRLWGPFVAVSAVAALNVELFYGLGTGGAHLVPRTVAGIETATVLAAVNCAALAWHARVFAREAAPTLSARIPAAA